jgi:hypothetical protein
VDIKKFYNRASAERVRKFFRDDLECSQDIAFMLSKLTTLDGHLPTGSPASPILSFFAYRELFDLCERLAVSQDAKITVYVDDVVVSGATVSGQVVNQILAVMRRFGLSGHKIDLAKRNRVAVVTGVALSPSGPTLPHKRWEKIRALEAEVAGASNSRLQRVYLASLLGQLREGAALVPALKQRAAVLQAKMKR